MDELAGGYTESCNKFLHGQQDRLEQETLERLEKITLANDVIDLGNDTGSRRINPRPCGPGNHDGRPGKFSRIKEKFEALRKITKQKEDLDRIDAVEKAADSYSGAMATFLDDWKKLQALGDKRMELSATMIGASAALADAGLENTERIANTALESLSIASGS